MDDRIGPVGGGPVAQELPHSRHARFRILRFREHFFQQGCLAVSKNVRQFHAGIGHIGQIAAEHTASLFGLQADQYDAERTTGTQGHRPGLHPIGGALVAGPVRRRHRRTIVHDQNGRRRR